MDDKAKYIIQITYSHEPDITDFYYTGKKIKRGGSLYAQGVFVDMEELIKKYSTYNRALQGIKSISRSCLHYWSDLQIVEFRQCG